MLEWGEHVAVVISSTARYDDELHAHISKVKWLHASSGVRFARAADALKIIEREHVLSAEMVRGEQDVLLIETQFRGALIFFVVPVERTEETIYRVTPGVMLEHCVAYEVPVESCVKATHMALEKAGYAVPAEGVRSSFIGATHAVVSDSPVVSRGCEARDAVEHTVGSSHPAFDDDPETGVLGHPERCTHLELVFHHAHAGMAHSTTRRRMCLGERPIAFPAGSWEARATMHVYACMGKSCDQLVPMGTVDPGEDAALRIHGEGWEVRVSVWHNAEGRLLVGNKGSGEPEDVESTSMRMPELWAQIAGEAEGGTPSERMHAIAREARRYRHTRD